MEEYEVYAPTEEDVEEFSNEILRWAWTNLWSERGNGNWKS